MTSIRNHARRSTVALLLLVGAIAPVVACASGPRVVEDPAAEDRRITEEVVRIIAERDDLVAEDIEVETHDGVVVLAGVQTSLEPVRELLGRVARVRGVVEVVNRIRILRSFGGGLDPSSGSGPRGRSGGGLSGPSSVGSAILRRRG